MPMSATSVAIAVLLAIGPLAYVLRTQRRTKQLLILQRSEDELHPLLKEHTSFRSYTTDYTSYSNIRTFYRPHSHGGSHSDISDLPLIVVVHGIGGVLPQFAGVLGSLTKIAPCFGLELPGHGRSTFAPRDYQAYTIEANVALWKTAIEDICERNGHSEIVLIGHSMGCSISALLASSTSTSPMLTVPVVGMISICPRGRPISATELKTAQRLAYIPNVFVDVLRWFDRRGGEYSHSVRRVVGRSQDLALRRMQLGWNRQFRTAVLKRITSGLLPQIASDGTTYGGYPSRSVWEGIGMPTFLIAGQDDHVTKPVELDRIIDFITNKGAAGTITIKEHQPKNETPAQASTNGMQPVTIEATQTHNVIQYIVFPSPAAHALPYAHTTYRLVSALIESFLATHVSKKLDFAYQLQLLTTSGKWDVKNLAKWQAVLPVSGPICCLSSPNGLFRALKTMREQDDEHNPTIFLNKWSNKVYAVIDISKDTPIYDTKKLEQGEVEYHKFPTVSKIPPTPIEVQEFCALVDKLLCEQDKKLKLATNGEAKQKRAIAVHCHYGYNRTGFFICSYLISHMGYGIEAALKEFAEAKPPGIRHEHFIDILHLRYAGAAGAAGVHNEVEVRDSRDELKKGKKREGQQAVQQEDDAGIESDWDLM